MEIYTGRTQSETRRNQHLPSPEPSISSPPMAGAYKAPVVEERVVLPDIVPMRRGRPTKNEPHARITKPSPSPLRAVTGDPFGALDAAPPVSGDPAAFDEVSSRFPPLDHFSLLHDSGSKFAFDPQSTSSPKPSQGMNQRVANALADEAFAQSAPPVKGLLTRVQPEDQTSSRASEDKGVYPGIKPPPVVGTIPSVAQKPMMVSAGTMTSPPPPETSAEGFKDTSRPVFKFPPSPVHRSLSQPRASDASLAAAANIRARAAPHKQAGLLDHRSKSQVNPAEILRSPASSRPSLEGQRPSKTALENSINRSKSATYRTRPLSDHIGSRMGLRPSPDRSAQPSPANEYPERFNLTDRSSTTITDDGGNEEARRIDSNVDFLRAMEEEDPSRRKQQRSGSGSKHIKRASMPSISLSSTKNLLSGGFGEAFRRFETTTSGNVARSPSPSPHRGLGELTPIAGSEATDGRSDDENALEETEVPPEVRRELERRRLSQEEKRVADGAAAYRQGLAQGGTGSRGRPNGEANSRATSIQNKVRSLLDESGAASPTKRAEGYGRFTQSPSRQQLDNPQSGILPETEQRQAPRMPPSNLRSSQAVGNPSAVPKGLAAEPRTSNSVAPLADRPPSRPSAPPKPQALRAGAREEQRPSSPMKPASFAGKALPQPSKDLTAAEADQWEAKFSKKYPSLAGLEMVETEIDRGPPAGLRIRDG